MTDFDRFYEFLGVFGRFWGYFRPFRGFPGGFHRYSSSSGAGVTIWAGKTSWLREKFFVIFSKMAFLEEKKT